MNNIHPVKHICFDLDGTIINSYATIYKSTLKTLEHLNIADYLDEPEFYKRIGHHFGDIFRDLNVNVPDVEYFINIYKSHYFNFIDDSVVYPGVEELFDFLYNRKIKVSLLTTKGQDQAEKIIEYFNLAKYFSLIMGRRIGLEIKPSPVPLEMICRELNVLPEETIMAGDSELDIRCGKNAGTKTCAVTYGYRTTEILQNENPDYIISGLNELTKIIRV